MSDATLALADLAAKLATVAEVRTGRAALEIPDNAELPVITLWSTDDRPAADQGYGYAVQFTRRATIECKLVATSAYHDALDTALTAIRRALREDLMSGSPLSGYATALRQNAASFWAPEDGSKIAVVQVTLEFDYLERFI